MSGCGAFHSAVTAHCSPSSRYPLNRSAPKELLDGRIAVEPLFVPRGADAHGALPTKMRSWMVRNGRHGLHPADARIPPLQVFAIRFRRTAPATGEGASCPV